MDGVPYKEYLIEAKPYQLAESGEWTINIDIWRERGNKIKKTTFSAGNTFRTKEEAIEHCIHFGSQVIDGEIDNCSVSNL